MGSVIALVVTGLYSNLIDNRIFTGIGLFMMGISEILFGNLNMQISPDSVLLPNIILGIGVEFALVSIMSITVMTLNKTQMTNASAIQNLLRYFLYCLHIDFHHLHSISGCFHLFAPGVEAFASIE